MKKYPLFDFDLKQIKKHTKTLEPQERILYLSFVITEYKLESSVFEADIGVVVKIPEKLNQKDFVQTLEKDIEDVKKALALPQRSSVRQSAPAPDKAIEKIIWSGNEPQLVYLFELLFKQNLISPDFYEKRFALIKNHFEDEEGNPYNKKQLLEIHSRFEMIETSRPKGVHEIEQIVEEVKNKK